MAWRLNAAPLACCGGSLAASAGEMAYKRNGLADNAAKSISGYNENK
jgi:hypothetical protein